MKKYKIIKEDGMYYVIRKADNAVIGCGSSREEAIEDARYNLESSKESNNEYYNNYTI